MPLVCWSTWRTVMTSGRYPPERSASVVSGARRSAIGISSVKRPCSTRRKIAAAVNVLVLLAIRKPASTARGVAVARSATPEAKLTSRFRAGTSTCTAKPGTLADARTASSMTALIWATTSAATGAVSGTGVVGRGPVVSGVAAVVVVTEGLVEATTATALSALIVSSLAQPVTSTIASAAIAIITVGRHRILRPPEITRRVVQLHSVSRGRPFAHRSGDRYVAVVGANPIPTILQDRSADR